MEGLGLLLLLVKQDSFVWAAQGWGAPQEVHHRSISNRKDQLLIQQEWELASATPIRPTTHKHQTRTPPLNSTTRPPNILMRMRA